MQEPDDRGTGESDCHGQITKTTGVETGGRALVRRLLSTIVQASDKEPPNQNGRKAQFG